MQKRWILEARKDKPFEEYEETYGQITPSEDEPLAITKLTWIFEKKMNKLTFNQNSFSYYLLGWVVSHIIDLAALNERELGCFV